ncbi:MAG: hypothetical protein ACT4SY_11845 [Hyphomicrobiales bacterium]
MTQAGWQPPRFENQPGSGVDFLGMHREMIAHVNQALAAAGNASWPKVTGWSPIPWTENDADWPVPAWPGALQPAIQARSPERVQQMKTLAQTRFQNPAWLSSVGLDRLGSEIEWTIHGWMHMRWSGPPFHDPQSADPANDWLYDPWSSHVNKTFWKLHGWIDERIGNWEQANSAVADLSNAWSGPPILHVHVTASAESSETNRMLASISEIRAVRFRFSQASVNRLLGRKAQAKPRKKARPKVLAKMKSSGTKRPKWSERQR